MDGQRDDVRLAIEERETEEHTLALGDTAALRDVVVVEFELCDRRGDSDSLSDAEAKADVDELRDDVRLAIEERETEEQPLVLGDIEALRNVVDVEFGL